MTTVEYIHRLVLPAAATLLPPEMDRPEARAQVLAIALQESGLLDRRQVVGEGRFGPARGFWQFEIGGGVAGVLTHPQTRALVTRVLDELRVVPAASACHTAIEHNDILAAVFARLLLRPIRALLPRRHEVEKGWTQYLLAWNPAQKGREQRDREKWGRAFAQAWALQEGS